MNRLINMLLPGPKPCPICKCKRIYSVFVGGGYEGCGYIEMLPYWVRMECSSCGRRTKKKLFRSRAVRAWNRDIIDGGT